MTNYIQFIIIEENTLLWKITSSKLELINNNIVILYLLEGLISLLLLRLLELFFHL